MVVRSQEGIDLVKTPTRIANQEKLLGVWRVTDKRSVFVLRMRWYDVCIPL